MQSPLTETPLQDSRKRKVFVELVKEMVGLRVELVVDSLVVQQVLLRVV